MWRFNTKILLFSKINALPIYLDYEPLRKIVLEKIIKSVKRDNSKGILEKLLLYTGENFNVNDLKKPVVFNGPNNGNWVSHTSKLINNKYVNNMEHIIIYNNEKGNNNEPQLQSHINEIYDYISYGYYKNFLDFYLSHFINFRLNVEDIINNIEYKGELKNQDTFKEKFENLLRSLNEEELILFNKVISGTSSLRNKYIIVLYKGTVFRLPAYHTCFNTMDILIDDNNGFEKRYINGMNGKIGKSIFVDDIKEAISSGFMVF